MANTIIQQYLNDQTVPVEKRRVIQKALKDKPQDESKIQSAISAKYGDKYMPANTEKSMPLNTAVYMNKYGMLPDEAKPGLQEGIKQYEEAEKAKEEVQAQIQKQTHPGGAQGYETAKAGVEGLKTLGSGAVDLVSSGSGAVQAGMQALTGVDAPIASVSTEEGLHERTMEEASTQGMEGLMKTIEGSIGTVFSPVTGEIESLPGGRTEEERNKAQNYWSNYISSPKDFIKSVMQSPMDATANMYKGIVKTVNPSIDVDSQEFESNVIKPLQTALSLGMMKSPAKVKTGLKAASAPIRGAGRLTKDLGEFGVKQASGLNKETLGTLIKEPKLYEKFDKLGIEKGETTFFEGTKKIIDNKINELSSIGKEYSPIRESGQTVKLPDNWFKNKLEDFGLKVDPKTNKVIATSESKVRGGGDLKAIQELQDMYGGKTTLTANELLNLRDDLSGLSRFGKETTKDIQPFAKDVRRDLNKIGRPQIQGLEALDKSFSPIISDLKQIKGLIYDRGGNLKSNALSNAVGLLNKSKKSALETLERFQPGITAELKALKALKDVEYAKGQKVGNYSGMARNMMTGAGAATGNIPVALAGLLASPTSIVAMLKSLGKTKLKIVEITPAQFETILSKIKEGAALTEKEVKATNKLIQSIAAEDLQD